MSNFWGEPSGCPQLGLPIDMASSAAAAGGHYYGHLYDVFTAYAAFAAATAAASSHCVVFVFLLLLLLGWLLAMLPWTQLVDKVCRYVRLTAKNAATQLSEGANDGHSKHASDSKNRGVGERLK